MSRSRVSWWEKANAIAPAAAGFYDQAHVPGVSDQTIALLLAVAQHETQCGDAWPGEHNWGATTRRPISPGERAALATAHVVPVLQPAAQRIASEKLATDTLRAAGIDPDDAAIHVDSRPPSIVYFTWFAKFPSDVEGAAYFATFFRTAAEKAALAAADPGALAAAMRAAGYYTGYHDERDPVNGAANRAANIADYYKAIAPIFETVKGALVGWSPGAEPPVYTEPAELDLSTTLGVQQALNQLCPKCAPLVEDGIAGPKTRAAIETWQNSHGLTVDGVVGAATVRSLRDALD